MHINPSWGMLPWPSLGSCGAHHTAVRGLCVNWGRLSSVWPKSSGDSTHSEKVSLGNGGCEEQGLSAPTSPGEHGGCCSGALSLRSVCHSAYFAIPNKWHSITRRELKSCPLQSAWKVINQDLLSGAYVLLGRNKTNSPAAWVPAMKSLQERFCYHFSL